MMCNHEGTTFYAKRKFANGTFHFCQQCGECGAIVKKDGKLWLKPEDVLGDEVLDFDEALYCGERKDSPNPF